MSVFIQNPFSFLYRQAQASATTVQQMARETGNVVQNGPVLTNSILTTLTSVQIASGILQKATFNIDENIKATLNAITPSICNAASMLQTSAAVIIDATNQIVPNMIGMTYMVQALAANGNQTVNETKPAIKELLENGTKTVIKVGNSFDKFLDKSFKLGCTVAAAAIGALGAGVSVHAGSDPANSQERIFGRVLMWGGGLFFTGSIAYSCYKIAKHYFTKRSEPDRDTQPPSGSGRNPVEPSRSPSQVPPRTPAAG